MKTALPPETLNDLQRVAKAVGTVLIFDEIITSFRWSPGGRQARDGFQPDLTTLAKVVTGGLLGGDVRAREDIIDLMSNIASQGGFAPSVSHKRAFIGSPLVAAA